MERRDIAVMLAICAVYAVVAFTNLGALEVPSAGRVLSPETGDVVLTFEEPADIGYLMAYAGYGAGALSVLASEDGTEWERVVLTDPFDAGGDGHVLAGIVDDWGDMWQWQRRSLDQRARHVMLRPAGGSVALLEMALLDHEGRMLVPDAVTDASGAPAPELFDEQDLVPAAPTHMTDMYFDEVYHVRTAYEHLHGIPPYETTHPPLGKILIAAGILLFGMDPFGWRFMGAFAGVAMLGVLYVLAKRLLRDTRLAAVAQVLLAADFMHYTQTRIATIDSFAVLWILLMWLFMWDFSRMALEGRPLRRTLRPLFLSGLFFGIGAATKWICLYAGAGLLVVWIATLARRMRHGRCAAQAAPESRAVRRKEMRRAILWSLLFFLAVPAATYLLSYLPHTLVADGGAWGLAEILENQAFMLRYHSALTETHPFQSAWYTWPLDVRPVLFYSAHSDAIGQTACLSTMGSPLVWWGGAAAGVLLALAALRRRRRPPDGMLLALGAGLCQWMPWWFISRPAFIYHYFATVPFLVLVLVYGLRGMEERFRWGRTVSGAYVAACAGVFGFFYPVTTGVPAPTAYIQALRWLPSWPFY